jgi:hypothetical protein
MAGDNQHHIPRLLMRGFKVEKKGKAEQVHLYRAGQAQAPCVNIMDINAREHFYSGPEDTSLDDAITASETEVFGPALHHVRTDQPLSEGEEHVLRRFLVHMIVRTESTRTLVGNVATGAMEGMRSAVSDPNVFTQVIQNGAVDLESIARKAIADAAAELAKRGIQVDAAMLEMMVARLPKFMRSNASQVGRDIAQYSSDAMADLPMPDSASGSAIQRKALLNGIAPAKRVAELETYILTVETLDDELILGDDPVLAFDAQGQSQRALIPDNPSVLYCLPASSHHAIVLRQEDSIALPSVARLNEVSAVQSRLHFIARTRQPEFLALAARIGSFKGANEQMDWGAFLKENIPKPD